LTGSVFRQFPFFYRMPKCVNRSRIVRFIREIFAIYVFVGGKRRI
jgi:hypothetical protein